MQLPGLPGISGFDDCRSLIHQSPMPWLLLTATHFERPQDVALWRETRADEPLSLYEMLWWDGREPATTVAQSGLPTAYFGRGKGVAVLRTSWRDDAVCATVLGQGRSHNVPDHTHADAGHFSIHAFGELLAYDTAYFNFDEDTHSVVLIDDTPHCRATQGNQYAGSFADTQRHALLDAVTIEAAAAKGCMWAERTCLFIRINDTAAYLVTLDNINRDNGMHNYKWQLQANLHCHIEVTDPLGQAIVRGEHARLDCHFFSPAPSDFPTAPHVLEVSADDAPHRHIMTGEPETNPRLVASLDGPNCTLMAVVIPQPLDAPGLTVRREHANRTFVVRVAHGDMVDQIVYACDHTYVRLPDLEAHSEIVVVRRRRDGRVLNSWTNDGQAIVAR
jgi:hypothetical protein